MIFQWQTMLFGSVFFFASQRSKFRTPHVAKLEFLEESVLQHGDHRRSCMVFPRGPSFLITLRKTSHSLGSWMIMVFLSSINMYCMSFLQCPYDILWLPDRFPMAFQWFAHNLHIVFTLLSHVRISIEHGHVERRQLLQKYRGRHRNISSIIRLGKVQCWGLQNFNAIFVKLDASWWKNNAK